MIKHKYERCAVFTLASVAVCCSVLQCVAVCCSVLQCVAVCCSVYSINTWSNTNMRDAHEQIDMQDLYTGGNIYMSKHIYDQTHLRDIHISKHTHKIYVWVNVIYSMHTYMYKHIHVHAACMHAACTHIPHTHMSKDSFQIYTSEYYMSYAYIHVDTYDTHIWVHTLLRYRRANITCRMHTYM